MGIVVATGWGLGLGGECDCAWVVGLQRRGVAFRRRFHGVWLHGLDTDLYYDLW